MNQNDTQAALHQQGNMATVQEHQQALYLLLQEFDRVCKTLGIQYFLFAGTLLGAVRHQGFIPWDDDLDVLMLREDYDRFLREAPAVIDTDRFFLQKEFSEHWPMFFSNLRLNGTACLEKYHPKDHKTHQGIYMDIFPCDHAYDTAIGRKLQFLCSKVIIAKGLDRRGYDTDSKVKKLFMLFCRILPAKPFLLFTKGPRKQGNYLHSFLGGASKFSKSVYPAACFDVYTELSFVSQQYPVPAGYDILLRILYNDYMKLPTQEERAQKQHSVLVDLKRSYEFYEGYRDGMEFEVPARSIR